MASKKVSKKSSARGKSAKVGSRKQSAAPAKKAPVKAAKGKPTKGKPTKAKKAPAMAAKKAPVVKKAASKAKSSLAKKAKAPLKAAKTIAKVVEKAKASLEGPVKTAKASVKKVLAKAVKTAKASLKKAPTKASTAAVASAAKVAPTIDVGSRAPAFSLQDQAGQVASSSDLSGQPYVLYFYPKDDTPGCTREACEFKDEHQAFRAAGITVFGVSPDSTKSHASFADKFSLPFRLLSDPDRTLAGAYGAWGPKQNYGREYMGIIRSTFVIGADGLVLAAYRGVKVDGHAQKVLARALEGAA